MNRISIVVLAAAAAASTVLPSASDNSAVDQSSAAAATPGRVPMQRGNMFSRVVEDVRREVSGN